MKTGTRGWLPLLIGIGAPLLSACASAPSISADAEPAAQGETTKTSELPAAPPKAQPTEGSFPPQEGDRSQLQEEKKKALLAQYLTQGQVAFQQRRYGQAMELFAAALDADPDNAEAREWLRRVQAAAGSPSQEGGGGLMQEVRDKESVRRAEALLAAEQAQAQGDNAMRTGDYQTAILRYREALLILRYNPFVSSPNLDVGVLNDKLQQALAAKASGAVARKEEIEQKAREEQAQREQARREYLEAKIRTLFESANTSFLNERYREAESYLDQLLLLDPENQEARSLREVAVSFRHETTDRDTRRRFVEEWQRTFEKLYGAEIPQTQTIDFDLRRWAEVSQRKPLEVAGPEPLQSFEEVEILNKLQNTVFPPRFDDAPIEEVATFLQHLTGVNFLLSTAARDMDPEKKKIRLDLGDTSVKKLLDILADISPFRYRINHGLVQIVTPEEIKGGQYLAFYEVRDITKAVTNFPAPDVNLIPSGGLEVVQEEPPERDAFLINESTLQDLIRNNIAPESWEADPRNTIKPQRGTLIVSQTREVHEKIKALLEDLREATGIMVDVQARFLTVEDNFLSDLGVDIRGLGNDAAAGVAGSGQSKDFDDYGTAVPTVIGNSFDSGAFYEFQGDSDVRARAENLYDLALGKGGVLTGSGGLSLQYTFLDNVELEVILRAVEKSERVQIINAPRLLVFNTERAHIRVLDKVTYIRDYDVQIAQAATVADPVVDWINAGVFLDVTPVVSADRRFITMELRPTVANLRKPIPTMAVNLATGSPVNIQLPELEIQRVRTTVSIPDGGTILLAGSSTVETQDFDSGVPFFNRIPILSFFFSRKGDFSRNKKLLILLRAKIVIPEEWEPKLTEAR